MYHQQGSETYGFHIFMLNQYDIILSRNEASKQKIVVVE